jgi:hypothetical protein
MRPVPAVFGLLVLLCSCSGEGPHGETATGADVITLPDITQKDNNNNSPRLHKIGNKEVQVGESLSILLVADDDDNDPLTYSAYGDVPENAKFYGDEGRFEWTPQVAGGPSSFVTFVVSDQKDFDSETVELRAVSTKTQHPPHFEPSGDQYLKIEELYELRLEASDEDGDMLTFKVLSGMPENGSFDAQNALFRWTPLKGDAGKLVRVNFQVSDGALTDEIEIRLIVEGGELTNHPPVVSDMGTIEAEVGVPLSFALDVSDPDDDLLTITVTNDLPAQAQFNMETHLFSWTPAASYAGKTETIWFEITDGTYNVTAMVGVFVKNKAAGCGDDEFEPNNTSEQAQKITDGTFANLSICDTAVSPIDEDWFELLLESNELVTATISSDHELGNLDLRLYKAGYYSEPLAKQPSSDDVESINYLASSPGTYHLRVFGTDSWKYAVPYEMMVERSSGGGCTDQYEPNDSISSFAMIEGGLLDGTVIAGLSLCEGDEDFYGFSLSKGDSVIASIAFENDNGDLDLELFNDSGGLLDKSAEVSDLESVISDGVPVAGTYLLRVSGFQGAANDYTLEVLQESAAGCNKDQYEPNDLPAEATSLTTTQTLSGITLCGDSDYFLLGSGGGEVTVTVAAANSSSLQAAFYDSFLPETPLPCQCANGTCIGIQTLPNVGQFYLKVDGAWGTIYSLDIVVEGGGSTEGSCAGKCEQDSGDCFCDDSCVGFGDCCPDACEICGYCIEA